MLEDATTAVEAYHGRKWLVIVHFSVEADVFGEIVEFLTIRIDGLERLYRCPFRYDDVVTFEFEIEVLDLIKVIWRTPADRAAI
jgi:hypothetical protein